MAAKLLGSPAASLGHVYTTGDGYATRMGQDNHLDIRVEGVGWFDTDGPELAAQPFSSGRLTIFVVEP